MKKFLLLLIILILHSKINLIRSQCVNTCGSNMLINSSFETPSSICGNMDIQIYNSQTPVEGWFGTDNYPNAGSSPDYFSACAGSTNSPNNVCFDGVSRVGIFTKTSFSDGREFLQSQLTSPLIAGKTYCFSMVVKSRVGSAGNLLSSCDGIGAWFHNQGLINIQTMNGGQQILGAGSLINAVPQIENPDGNLIGADCEIVTGTFCAQGGESWIVIGNFKTDAGTTMTGSNPSNYMYIDDVNLFEVCGSTLNLNVDASNLACGESTNINVASTYPLGTTYTWISPLGNTLSGINSQLIAPVNTTTYTLVASYNGGCGLILDTVSVTVNVDPCGITSTIPDGQICIGSCFDLLASNTNGGAAPYIFEWKDEADNIIGSSEGPITVCPNTTSKYYVKIIDQNGVEFIDSSIVTVSNFPTINAGLDFEICQGNAITLTGVSDGNVEQWQTLGFGNLFQVSPLQTTSYVFEASNGACSSFDTVQVIVNPQPIINLNATNISCSGSNDGSASVIATGEEPFAYFWSNGETSDMVQNLISGYISVTITDANNCQNQDSINILEPLQISYQLSGDTVLCQGSVVNLNINTSGGVNPITVTWDNLIQGSNYSFTPNSSGLINLTIVDDNNCQLDDQISITVNPSPTAVFDTLIQVCENQIVTLNSNSVGANSYNWYLNSLLVSTQENPTLSSFSNGCNDVGLLVQNEFGCTDSIIKQCAIYMSSAPLSLIYAFDTEFIIGDPDIELLNNSVGSSYNCSWYVNNALISGECLPSISYTFDEIGNYRFDLIISNELGCSDTSFLYITVKEGLIYYVPNSFTPDGNEINNTFKPVFTSGFDPTTYKLQIFDRWGELLFESNNFSIGWDGSYLNKLCKSDTYTWTINFRDTIDNLIHNEVGHVNLIK